MDLRACIFGPVFMDWYWVFFFITSFHLGLNFMCLLSSRQRISYIVYSSNLPLFDFTGNVNNSNKAQIWVDIFFLRLSFCRDLLHSKFLGFGWAFFFPLGGQTILSWVNEIFATSICLHFRPLLPCNLNTLSVEQSCLQLICCCTVIINKITWIM